MRNDFSEFRKKEKSNIESEITAIFDYEVLLPVSVLKGVRARAIIYELDQSLIDRLDKYINIVLKITESQDVLRARVDLSVLSKQKLVLNNISVHEFNFLRKKANEIFDLLDIYCFKNTQLFDLLAWADGYGVIDSHYKAALGSRLFEFMPFPFLFQELSNKLDDINYKSAIIECY